MLGGGTPATAVHEPPGCWRPALVLRAKTAPSALVASNCKVMGMHVTETVHAESRFSVESPGYRVNFWQKTSLGSWNLDAYVLSDVDDVGEVLRWVEEHASGRRFEVFAELDAETLGAFETPRFTGLVRLLGTNPNVGESVVVVHLEKI